MSPTTDILEVQAPNQQTAGEPKAATVSKDQQTAPAQPENIRWLGIELPGPVTDAIRAVHDFGQRCRRATIDALPIRFVNSSSNVIGATQLVGEVMMMKANNTVFFPKVTDPVKKAQMDANVLKKAWYYVSSPFISTYKSIFKGGGARKLHAADMLKGSFWKEEVGEFFNLEKATLRDSLNGSTALINRWQARSTFAGLTGMAFAAAMPDVKDTDEEIEKRVSMRYKHPFLYVGKTIGEALWFPIETMMAVGQKILGKEPDEQVGKHKRQFTGLGLTIAGICSFLSGFRNVKGNFGNQAYGSNPAHSIGGMITAIAGSQLLLSVGSDQGWERFGAIQWLRMAFLPKSIGNRYKPDAMGRLDPGRHYYMAGQGFLQGANTESFLFGGATVREDGTIVDNKVKRDEAVRETKQKVKEMKVARKAARSGGVVSNVADDAVAGAALVPDTKIATQAAQVEPAMPERVKAEAQKDAVALTA